MLIQSTSLTLMILLHLAAKWGYTQPTDLEHDDYYRDVCEIQDPFKSPYIRAFYERPLTIMSSNCEVEVDSEDSDDDFNLHTTSPSQEVHVVKMLSSSISAENHHRGLRISFRIKPQETSGILEKKLVFVLVSNISIKWKIHLERIRHSSELHFWVANGSSVVPDQRLNMNLHQLSLPSTSTEPLLDWVSQRLGPITTITEVKPSRTLVHTVGIVDTALRCPDTTPETTAKEISGCLATWSKGRKNKDVHVIELNENMVNTNTQTTTTTVATKVTTMTMAVHPVVIEIHPRTISKPLLRKHLLLVLKSHQPTKWVVRTAGLRGTLDIVTDRAVDKNRVGMQATRVVNEQLSSLSGMDLVIWTSEQYGEPISYTNAQLANKFDVTVDGRDEETTEVGQQVQQVVCNQKHMTVSLSKRFQINKFATMQLSLVDPSCRAQENRTHYYWAVSLTACGTVQQTLHTDQITYKNAIIIQVVKTVSGQLFDQSGSGFEPPLDHTLVDDENLNLDLPGIIRLDFQCTYPYEHKGPGIHYHMKLYKDTNFQHEMLQFPTLVDDKEKLYVEASITPEQGIQVMIQNCTLTSPTSEQPGHYLIRSGCPYEKRVKWIEAGSLGHTRRFEFVFEKFWTGSGVVVLECRLSVCARSSRDPLIHQCPSRERDCLLSDPGGSSGSSILSRSLSVGPLVLQSPVTGPVLSVQDTSTQVAMVQSGPLEEYARSGGCAQVVHTEGLDPPTVVGIAFAAFTIGVLLTGALWFIHSHTGPIKKHAKGLRSAETSGESTPSSTAPMAIRPSSHKHHV